MHNIWRCPVCSDQLQQLGRTLVCEHKHSFDMARSGYVNLLLANQKGSKHPGDNSEMTRGRTEFLNRGYYQTLSDLLNLLVLELQLPEYTVLDAGCGEGYFLRRLQEALVERFSPEQVACFGVDISKAAAELAAKQSKTMQIVVASTFHLPVLSESVDVLLKTMAPADQAEIHRVLRPGGHYLTVTPGPWHLQGLKQLIYPKTGPNEVGDAELPGFTLEDEQLARHELQLTANSDIVNLLAMTPYYWNINAEARARVAACQELLTPMEFVVRVYRKS